MAQITPGQEKLQVAAPSRIIAQRQPLDFGALAENMSQQLSGVLAEKRAREVDQKKLQDSKSTQELILKNQLWYTEKRDSEIAAGTWNKETAYKTKAFAKMKLRSDMLRANVFDKDLMAHAESQASDVHVDGEWTEIDGGPYYKTIISPNGVAVGVTRDPRESVAFLLHDKSKTDPLLAKQLSQGLLNGEVRDANGAVVMNYDIASDMLTSMAQKQNDLEKAKVEFNEALTRQKTQFEIQSKQLGIQRTKLDIQASMQDAILKQVETLKPIYMASFNAEATATARTLANNTDFAVKSKEAYIAEFKSKLNNITTGELYQSYDADSGDGSSINRQLAAHANGRIDDIATKIGSKVWEEYVANPDLAKNIQYQNAFWEMVEDVGGEVALNTAMGRAVMRQVGFDTSKIEGHKSMEDMFQTMFGGISGGAIARIERGDLRTKQDKFAYMILKNNQLSDVERADVDLRVSLPNTSEFDGAFMRLFNTVKAYANAEGEEAGSGIVAPVYLAASMMQTNPKIKEHLTLTPGYTPEDITRLFKTIDDVVAQTKARLTVIDKSLPPNFSQLDLLDKKLESVSKAWEDTITDGTTDE